MTSRTALKITLQMVRERTTTYPSPASVVNAYWDEVFPGHQLSETTQNAYHNEVETVTDWWKAAGRLEHAAFEYLVERLDRVP